MLAALMGILAWQQSVAGAHARREAALERLQSELLQTQVEELRQLLEAERIIAAREIATLRAQAQAPR